MESIKMILKKFMCWIVFFIYQLLIGQIDTINTVIPVKTTEEVISINSQPTQLIFNLNTILEASTIKSSVLQLVLEKDVTRKQTLECKISGQTFGYLYLDPSFKKDTILTIEGDESLIKLTENQEILLSTRSFDTSNAIHIYGKNDVNLSPRFIIEYNQGSEPPVFWAMSHANEQHANQTKMRFRGAVPISYKASEIGRYGDIQKDLVTYKGNVYVINNENSQTLLLSIDPISGSKAVVHNNLSPAATMPVIDSFGRLYYTTVNGIDVIELENGNKLTSVLSYEDKNFDKDEHIGASPTIGPDGSLYLVTNKYIRAYSPFPENQLKWKYYTESTKSSVTLNKAGTKAYVVSYVENNTKIIALNTINGSESKSKVVEVKKEENEGTTIPLVTDEGLVFLTSKLYDAQKLYIFNETLELKDSIEGNNISISQVAQGKESRVYFTKNKELMYYKNGAAKLVKELNGIETVRSLVADASNNVYCYGTNNILNIYNDLKNSLITYKIPETILTGGKQTSSMIGLQQALVIANNGMLYSATSSKLIKVKVDDIDGYTVVKNDLDCNNCTIRGADLQVPKNSEFNKNQILLGVKNIDFKSNITIEKEASLVLESGNTISFESGFSVEKGAELNCSIGY